MDTASEGLSPLVEHLFRHQSGRLVASLTRLFGASHLEMAEDVVQDTLLRAMREWPFRGIPDDPPAWLFRVARNLAVDRLRRDARGLTLLQSNAALLRSEWTLSSTVREALDEQAVEDDLLRMMFACCHPALPREQQVALALRALCGFGVPEIARAFLTNEETINKRLHRARTAFREIGRLEVPSSADLASRMEHVLATIYLLFNEGYSATQHAGLIREDLIEEALRLADLLTRDPRTDLPEVRALLALMLYHTARGDARLDAEGAIVLLPDQDRTRWDRSLIRLADHHLEAASTGEEVTAYHLEAAIAAIHVHAPSYALTDHAGLVTLYDRLWRIRATPVVALNRAIALGQWKGAEAGLAALEKLDGLDELHLYHAARGDALRDLKRMPEARDAYARALALARSPAESALLRRKLERVVPDLS